MAPDRTRHTRRRFLQSGLALASLTLASGCGQTPLPWQQPGKVHRIGVMGESAADPLEARLWQAFRLGLRERGWIEGENILIEHRWADLARRHRLPTIYLNREAAEAGALMSYGPNLEALGRSAPRFVDKILRGATPAELPVEQATRFEFVINLKAAGALGLTVPESVLQQATELIQ